MLEQYNIVEIKKNIIERRKIMIDSEKTIKTTKLQLVELNIEHIQQGSFDHVKQNLQTIATNYSYLNYIFVGLNRQQEIVIGKVDQPTLGIKYFKYAPIKDLDIDDATNRVVSRYISWLKHQYQYQHNLNDADLHLLIKRHYQGALFTDQSFADYLITNLDHISGELIDDFLAVIKTASLRQYLVTNALLQIPKIQQVNSSVINGIINIIKSSQSSQADFTFNTLITNLYKAIMATNKLSINFDEPIKYTDLIPELPKNIKAHLKLPISAIPELVPNWYHQDASLINAEFVLLGRKDLQLLINGLLTMSNLSDIELLIDSRDINLKLTKDDKTIISEMIDYIKELFTNTKQLQQLIPILENFSRLPTTNQ